MAAGALEIELILRADRARGDIEATRLRIDALQKQVNEFNTTGARLERLGDSFKSIATAVGGVVIAVGAAARGIAELAAQHDTHTRAVTRLGAAYDLVTQATNGVVTAEQALKVQQSLAQAGHALTAEQLAIVTRRAREYAQATGTDLNQALDQVTDALRGMEAEGLRRFGLSVNSNRTYTENLTSALNQMRDSFHGASPAARTMEEDLARTDRTMAQFAGTIAASIANLIGLRAAMGSISDYLSGDLDRRINRTEASIAETRAHNAALDRVTAAREGRDGYRSTRINFQGRDLSQYSTADLNELANQAQFGQQHIDDTLARIDARAAGAIVDGITGAARTNIQSSRDAFERRVQDRNAAMVGDKAPAATAGQHGSHEDPELAIINAIHQSEVAKAEANRVLNDTILQQEREAQEQRLEQERQAADERLDEQQRSNAAALAESIRSKEALTEVTEQRLREENSLGTQLSQRFAAHAELHETRAQGMAGLIEGAYNTMTGALKQHIAAVAQGKESIGEALKATVEEVLLNLAVESTVKAIFETAQGIAAAASGAAPVAAGHFASAGMYAAVAAAGFGGYAAVGALGGSSAPASAVGFGGSPGAAASTRGPGSAANDNGGGGDVYNINVNGFAATEVGVQNAVADALERHAGRGRRIRGLRYAA